VHHGAAAQAATEKRVDPAHGAIREHGVEAVRSEQLVSGLAQDEAAEHQHEQGEYAQVKTGPR
jgi:hypothetical protein